MESNNTLVAPAISSESEAMAIMNDQSNPHHNDLHDETSPRHGIVKSAMEKFWAVKNPTLQRQIDEDRLVNAVITGAPDPEKVVEGELQAPAAPTDYAAVETEVITGLRQEFGDRFEESMGFGGVALRAAFPTWDAAQSFARQTNLGADPILYGEVMRTLVKIGRKMARR